MARLNEPASSTANPSTTSGELESLKRRFLRQNRELARVNSTQSVKIRNLETQISQLVAENCSVRGEVNQLRVALDESRSERRLKNVDEIRNELQGKLREVEALVGGLGEIGKRKSNHRRESEAVRSPQKSPNQKAWRSQQSIGDVIDLPQSRQPEGFMPTIVEDKHFPRRTLEPSDFSTLQEQESGDSPDIGPPPRTFLDRQDSFEGVKGKVQDENEDLELPDFLSANLETRRRRRETNVRRDSSLVSAQDLSPTKENPRPSELLSGQPVRAGAKRKLDSGDRPNTTQQTSPMKASEEVVFHRKQDGSKATAFGISNSSPVRKALAPKPVNTDPVVISPRKVDRIDAAKDKPGKKPFPRETQRGARRVDAQEPVHVDLSQPQTEPLPTTEIDLAPIKLEPKTPAPFDMFSPVSTQPSEAKAEGRSGTPPPTDLSRGSTDGANTGRGSRRARSQVSYAEPSLVSKMRRPGKEMANAVDQNKRRSSSAQLEVKREESEGPPTRTVVLERTERCRDSKSALASAEHVPVAESSRREPQSPLSERPEANKNDQSGASGGRDTRNLPEQDTTRPRQASRRSSVGSTARQRSEQSLDEKMQSLDIYDVQDSPDPPFPLKAEAPRPKSQANSRPSSANSNRPTSSSTTRPAQLDRARSTNDLAKPRTNRRQTLGSGTNSSDLGLNNGGKDTRAARPTPARNTPSATEASNSAREERPPSAVGRRRSMIL